MRKHLFLGMFDTSKNTASSLPPASEAVQAKQCMFQPTHELISKRCCI
jgi:hypothetical protein